MNDLITIQERDGRETVDARELHAALEVARDFSTWIKDRIEKYGFIAGKDYETCSPDLGSEKHGGQNRVEYALTVAMAKELATVENNDKGREVRRYLIQVEEAWNSPELVMARALQAASKTIEAHRNRIAMLEPKAAFFDQVADAKDALDMRQAAAVLNMPGLGRTKLFGLLRAKGILDAKNLPYRRYQDEGWFRVVETTYTDAYGETHVNTKTLVYQRGLDAIRRLAGR